MSRSEPQTNIPRSSYPKETRSTPVDQLENQLKQLGILNSGPDLPPHRNFNMQGVKVKGRKKGATVIVRDGPRVARRPKPKMDDGNRKGVNVSMAAGQYPTMSDSVRDSLMISAPTSKAYLNRSGRPNLQYGPNGDCRIRHREFLSDITGSVAFAVNTFQVNPGLVGSFPWLSRIAGNYESYVFENLRFHYGTEASTASTGSLIMSLDYDPSDSAPTTKMQALTYRGAVRSSPWAPCLHTSIREDLTKRKTYYVRAGGLTPGLDVTLYDTGNLYVITVGQGAATVIGELWVEYDIRLMTPRSLSAGGGNAVWSRYSVGPTNATLAVYNAGNLPATVVNTGTVAAVATFTFNQPWQGSVSWAVGGTAITSTTIGGTAANSGLGAAINGAATLVVARSEINAIQGQTVILTVNNTTIDGSGNSSITFTQGFGAYQ